MFLQFSLASKSEKARQAGKLVPDSIVVFEVVLEAPLIIEGAQAQVAEHVVAGSVVDMVLKSVAVLKHTLT